MLSLIGLMLGIRRPGKTGRRWPVSRRKSHGDGPTREVVRGCQDCPLCRAVAGTACDRGRDRWLSTADRAELQAEGANHYERMLVAYGHSPARALQLAK